MDWFALPLILPLLVVSRFDAIPHVVSLADVLISAPADVLSYRDAVCSAQLSILACCCYYAGYCYLLRLLAGVLAGRLCSRRSLCSAFVLGISYWPWLQGRRLTK